MNQGNGGIKVVKSDGSKVSIDLEKIHRMVENVGILQVYQNHQLK